MKIIILIIVLLNVILKKTLARPRFPVTPKQEPSTPKPKPILHNVDALPLLQDVLTELDFSKYIKEFVKLGYAETRLLLRMTSMDFRLLMLETNMTEDDINKLKIKIEELLAIATIPQPSKERPDLEQRSKLNYGRIYIQGFVQSFEYLLGTF